MVNSSFADKTNEAASSVGRAAASGIDDVRSRVVDSGDKAAELAEAQKNRAAVGLHGLAGTADAAAGRLESHLPSAADAVRGAASRADRASRDLHAQSVEDLGAGVARFAREKPVSALAAAFVAGIFLSRAFSAR